MKRNLGALLILATCLSFGVEGFSAGPRGRAKPATERRDARPAAGTPEAERRTESLDRMRDAMSKKGAKFESNDAMMKNLEAKSKSVHDAVEALAKNKSIAKDDPGMESVGELVKQVLNGEAKGEGVREIADILTKLNEEMADVTIEQRLEKIMSEIKRKDESGTEVSLWDLFKKLCLKRG